MTDLAPDPGPECGEPLEGPEDSPGPDPLQLAYRYLNRRERTVAEVRAYLEQRGCHEPAVATAIEQLQQQGFLDDARYARLFVEDRRALDDWGNERIERSLRERGLDPDLIADALSDTDRGDELQRAIDVLSRRFPEPPRDRHSRDRALGMLVRKGYEPELALDALSAYARATRSVPFR